MAELVGPEEAQQLLDAATPGPWTYALEACECGGDFPCGHGGQRTELNLPNSAHPNYGGVGEVCELGDGDAELLAAAPRLAETVVALHRLIEELPDHSHRDCCLNDLRTAAARLLGGDTDG